jgi:hypothetical protein
MAEETPRFIARRNATRFADFLDIDQNFTVRHLFNVFFELGYFGAFFTDNNPGPGGINPQTHTLGGAFNFNSRHARMVEFFFNELS